jgi:hypothetical protein
MPKKTPTGRPVIVKVTLTKAQGDALQHAAMHLGIPLAIYVRQAAMEKMQAAWPSYPMSNPNADKATPQT